MGAVVVALLLSSFWSAAHAVTIHVPADQPTIQAGIDLVSGATFADNTSDYGAGLYSRGPPYPIVENTEFRENSATYGGAVGCGEGSSPSILDCLFVDNFAVVTGSTGRGGAFHCSVYSTPAITRCTFLGNWAGQGGAVRCLNNSSSTFTDAVIDETVIASGIHGGAIHCGFDIMVVTFRCCDIFGNPGGDWTSCAAASAGTNGNFSANPLFCDTENGDFTIRSDSPCAPNTGPMGECSLVGAFGVGCTVVAVPEGIESLSWGGIKARYR